MTDADLIDLLIATPRQATATKAARTQPAGSPDPAAHDGYTRLLHRPEPDAAALWAEVEPDVRRKSGVLVVDDSVLDEPYARAMDLVHRQWSGKHHGLVKGIGLVTLLWADGGPTSSDASAASAGPSGATSGWPCGRSSWSSGTASGRA